MLNRKISYALCFVGLILSLMLLTACAVQRPCCPPVVQKCGPPLYPIPVARPIPRHFTGELVDVRKELPKEFKKTLIVIDPGHGGQDYGTESKTSPKYHEKSLNLTTALMLKDYLQKMGYSVSMTRSVDKFIELKKRADFANDQDPALFVSVHYNSAPSKEAEGIEIYYYRSTENKLRTSDSKHLAEVILKKVLNNTEAKSRGVKHGNFAVIRETQMPAVLVEGGFVTSEDELRRLKDPAYLKRIAWGIAEGVNEYLKSENKEAKS
jgi:N-acetylmuramoyl-L-alanine amidase